MQGGSNVVSFTPLKTPTEHLRQSLEGLLRHPWTSEEELRSRCAVVAAQASRIEDVVTKRDSRIPGEVVALMPRAAGSGDQGEFARKSSVID